VQLVVLGDDTQTYHVVIKSNWGWLSIATLRRKTWK